MATSWSEGTGTEEGVEALPSTSRKEEYEELSLNSSHEELENFWARITDRGNEKRLVAGVFCRLSDQAQPVGKAFLLQLQEAVH